MKLSREWLGEYTTIGAPDKEYCDAMTMSGSKEMCIRDSCSSVG